MGSGKSNLSRHSENPMRQQHGIDNVDEVLLIWWTCLRAANS